MHHFRQPSIEPLEPRELLALVPQTITVRVFLDHNSDQRRNHNEIGIAGYRVTAKGLQSAQGKKIAASATTDSRGIARFTTYLDSQATDPPHASVSLGANAHYNCLNQPISMKGTVYGDAHPNIAFAMVDYVERGAFVFNSYTMGGQQFDDGLAGRTVFDDVNGNGKRDKGETQSVTDDLGWYQLKLRMGKHTLRVIATDDWTAASGSGLSRTFNVTPLPVHDENPAEFSLTMKNPVIIDLLVGYARGASDYVDADDGAKQHITEMVQVANEIFANSDTNVRINLVQRVYVPYRESGDINKDLARLQDPNDGYLDELIDAREKLHADLVTLIDGPDFGTGGTPEDDNVVGLGYQYQRAFGNDDDLAFTVVRTAGDSFEDGSTLAHELGHNLGAGHDADHAKDEYLTARYAHGYRFRGNDGEMYQDVMAYGSGTELPFFSTPLFKYAGKLIGDASTADNARVIRQIAPDVATYR
jgi:hypothetical protein